MAVKIDVEGKKLLLNSTQYSVTEDSTPINPADESGGTAEINYAVPVFPGWKSQRRKSIELADTTQGKTQGKIMSVSEKNGLLQFTAQSRILNMATQRTAQPYSGNLRGAILYYLSLVDITDKIVIEDGFELIEVDFPGWVDDVYQMIARKLCPAWSIEMSLVGENVVFRSLRGRKAIIRRAEQLTQVIDDGSVAQNTKMTWYKTREVVDSLVYPPGGWTSDVEVLDVNSNETKFWDDIQLNTSVSSIIQPTCTSDIGPDFSSASVYTVSGTDGLPIPPQMWADYGGDLRVEINEDTKSLKVTVVGMAFDQYAPYSIGIASGPSNFYSTLRIVGSGVELNPTELLHNTALSTDDAPDEYGDEVDNIFIISKQQSADVSAWQLAEANGPRHVLNFESAGINRVKDSGSYNFATFQDFDNHFYGKTFADADAEWAGKDGYDWDEFWANYKQSDFSNQAFGNIAGARIYFDDSIFRIRTCTNSGGKITGSAEADNTIADFDLYYDGMTIEEFDQMWAGKTIEDFDNGPFPGIR